MPDDTLPDAIQRGAGRQTALLALAIVALVLLAYWPAFHAGFIWDDDDYVTNNRTLLDVQGLKDIWLKPEATPQYYPLVHTTYWLEHHAWKLNPLGYHIINVLFHTFGSLLLWRVLLRLRLPGAWLAAAIFAVHPVNVESVAWITERKNVLSGVFYFVAALAYLRFWELNDSNDHTRRRWIYYAVAFVFFLCALFSKTVTCSLPAALLLVRWWKYGRLTRHDVFALLPFFGLGIAFGLATSHMEKIHVGAQGDDWELNFLERCLIAGRALWFYAGKLVWPADLTFIYPRWEISTAVWWQWLFPLAAAGMVIILWLLRNRIGRGPLVAVLFFAGTAFPALGIINIYPMRFSFVADHFQYLASLGLIVVATYGLSRARWAWGILILPVLAMLTWQQTRIYKDLETLWRDTIAKNPKCWMANDNLGLVLKDAGRQDEAEVLFRTSLAIKPNDVLALANLGDLRFNQGRTDESIDYYRQSLKFDPHLIISLNGLGRSLLKQKRAEEALDSFRMAHRLKPDDADVLYNIGVAWTMMRRIPEATDAFRSALKLNPEHFNALRNLGDLLFEAGDFHEAKRCYLAAIQARPDYGPAHLKLGVLLAQEGNEAGAIATWQQLLTLQPDDVDVLNSLAWLQATSKHNTVRNSTAALALALRASHLSDYENPAVLDTLAAAYADQGRFDEAISTAIEASKLAEAAEKKTLLKQIQTHLKRYESGMPWFE